MAAVTAGALGIVGVGVLTSPVVADTPTPPAGGRVYMATDTTASDPYVFRCQAPDDRASIGYCMVTSSDLTGGPIRVGTAGANYYPMNTTRMFYSPDGKRWQDKGTALSESKLGIRNGSDGKPANHLWAPAVRFEKDGLRRETGHYYLYTPDLTNPDDALSSRIYVTYSDKIGTQFGDQRLPGTNVKVAKVTGAPDHWYMSDPEVFTDTDEIGQVGVGNDFLIWANGDNSTCGDISVRSMTSRTSVQGMQDRDFDSVRIKVTGFPAAWAKCTPTAGRFFNPRSPGTQVDWPYVEGASMFRRSAFEHDPPQGRLPGTYILLMSVKPSSVPAECATGKGQPGTANEILAYATGSAPRGPFAYQGIIMCGSSTEWTNQGTITEVQSGSGHKRLMLVYHDGPNPGGQPGQARQRRLHSECLYSFDSRFQLTTRSWDNALRKNGDPSWCLKEKTIVAFERPANPDGTHFQADGEGVITATGYSAVPGAQFSWVKSGSGTYNDGFKARLNGAWVQFNRNGGEKLQARGEAFGSWEQFDFRFPSEVTGGWGSFRDNRGLYLTMRTDGSLVAGSPTPPTGNGRPWLKVLAD